jgi:tetratricopeptide (TPR) repeat protein
VILYRERRAEFGIVQEEGERAVNRWRNGTISKSEGIACAARGDLEKSVATLSEAIRIAPEDPSAYKVRGGVRIIMHQYETAVSDLTRAIALNPNDEELFELRSEAYVRMGKQLEALSDSLRMSEIGVKRTDRLHKILEKKVNDLERRMNAEAEFGTRP